MSFFKSFLISVFILLSCVISAQSFGMQNLFYILRGDGNDEQNKAALAQFEKHYQMVDVLVSQAYRVDANGTIKGYVNPEALSFSQAHGVKVMPMVTNGNFDQYTSHRFLNHTFAINKMIRTLLFECQQHHYDGIQIDFENVSIKDESALLRFYKKIINVMHNAGFEVSFAVEPLTTHNAKRYAFLKDIYQGLEGFNKNDSHHSADFVSIMAYDEHCLGTNPGPNAAIDWVDKTIRLALQYIPSQKIFLGIPDYSYFWDTEKKRTKFGSQVKHNVWDLSFNEVYRLMKTWHFHLKWDYIQKVDYASFWNHYFHEYIFVEDVRSFKEKFNLAQKYHLEGVSIFRLGLEDPRIWNVLARSEKIVVAQAEV